MTNPLITKHRSLLPGQVFRLPSRGVFYKDKGILSDDVQNGEVLVNRMRLREELAMKSVDAIFQGTAITETLNYCVPQILDPSRLVSEDIDYLLTAIKKLTHGNYITYRDKCFDVNRNVDDESDSDVVNENAKRELEGVEFEDLIQRHMEQENLEEQGETSVVNKEIRGEFCEFQIPISHFLDNCKEINEETFEDDYVTDFNGFTLYVKPISLMDFKELSTLRLEEKKINSEEDYIKYITKFSNMHICSRLAKVDDIEDREMIYEWVDSLGVKEREDLFKKLTDISDWGINFEYEVTCTRCGITKKTDQSYINPLYFFF